MTKTVFQIFYKEGKEYKPFNTKDPITDYLASVQLRRAVMQMKSTNDVIVTNAIVREKSNGEVAVKQLANRFVKFS